MGHSGYTTEISEAYDYYEFFSVGVRGIIPKAIIFFQDKENPLDFYCVMGDVKEDESIDSNVITDNGDMVKVLATVIDATTLFLNQYPDCQVSIKGSNDVRTRLYRMAINQNYEMLSQLFYINGVFEEVRIIENFERGSVKNYDSFLVKRKK